MLKIFYKIMVINLLTLSFVVAGPNLLPFDGTPESINKYMEKGKWLVVMIWASDCHVCNQEANQYVKFHQAHTVKDASVLGISMDGKQKRTDAEKFLEQHDVNFPNLIGEPMRVANLYQQLTGGPWLGTPSFLVYGPDGELRGAQAGAVPTSIIESFIEQEVEREAQQVGAKTS
jgi:peroxiredoxin